MREQEPPVGDIDFEAPKVEREPTDEELVEHTYLDSEILNKRDVQEERGERFGVTFTDIDNTFFRADRAQASAELAHRAEQHNYPIVAVTGNDFAGVKNRINGGELPAFDMIIGSVGTEIYVRQGHGVTYEKDEYYDRMLARTGFDRPNIAKRVEEFMASYNQLQPNADLVFQNPEAETAYLETSDEKEVQPYKISCFFYANSPEEVAVISAQAAEQFPEQDIVVCEEIGYNATLKEADDRKKYNIDFLPITKAGAVKYASDILGVERGILAGDSGNDIDMLLKSGTLAAVVVGGAKAELKEAAITAGAKRHKRFTIVEDDAGQPKAIYVENDESRLGPDSILHAAEVLRRAERIKERNPDRKT